MSPVGKYPLIAVGLMGILVITSWAERFGGSRSTRLMLNVSSSLPGWLFVCTPLVSDHRLQVGELVEVHPPPQVRVILQQVGPNWKNDLPWLKHVAGITGDHVCWEHDALWINAHRVGALPLLHDYPLVPFAGCRTLAAEELVILGTHPRSFDSRYIGAITTRMVAATCQRL